VTARAGTPRVVVVTIFRDAGPFIAEAIDSVLAQTVADLELVLVDDGSTDASTGIARDAARAHPDRVRYVEHPGHANRGMSASRNLGVASCTAPVIALLDADDRWDPGHLATHLAALDAHPDAGIAAGPAWRWRSWDGGTDEATPTAYPPGTVVSTPKMLAATLRRGEFAVPTCALVVRRRAWEAVGGAVTAFRDMYEDQALAARLHLATPTVVVAGPSAWYRQHAASASSRAIASGAYHPEQPTLARARYLDWLAGTVAAAEIPAHDRAELQSLLDAARARMGSRGAMLARKYARRAPAPVRRIMSLGRALRHRAPSHTGRETS
jgi:glycosyltransferase involved in cell wall biosynthesis